MRTALQKSDDETGGQNHEKTDTVANRGVDVDGSERGVETLSRLELF